MEDTPAFAAAQLLANDTDIDGDQPDDYGGGEREQRTVVLSGNGTMTFTPAANFNGAASFSYTASDGQAGSNTGTVAVT